MNKSRYSREVGHFESIHLICEGNSLQSRVTFPTQQTQIQVMRGASVRRQSSEGLAELRMHLPGLMRAERR